MRPRFTSKTGIVCQQNIREPRTPKSGNYDPKPTQQLNAGMVHNWVRGLLTLKAHYSIFHAQANFA